MRQLLLGGTGFKIDFIVWKQSKVMKVPHDAVGLKLTL